MQKFLLTVALVLGLAWAAPVAGRMVEVLDTAGRVVATGTLSGHLTVRGDLGTARTVRVRTTVNGVTTVQTFTLAAPITARDPEAERLGVSIGGRVMTLEAAVQGQNEPGRGGADDGAGHDAGDDHGGAAGGHGVDDGASHDAGDDHSGNGGRHGGDDGAGHDAGDDHGGGRGGHGGDDGRGHR